VKVLVLNGPNLARLGTREPDIYGATTWPQLQQRVQAYGAQRDLQVDVRQTDSEAELIGWLHEAADEQVPVILNPAAFTHYSYGVRDAAAQLRAPLIEVHISNPAARGVPAHLGDRRRGDWDDRGLRHWQLPAGP